MKIALNLPMMFRAMPKGRKKVFQILCIRGFEAEIREISPREAVPVDRELCGRQAPVIFHGGRFYAKVKDGHDALSTHIDRGSPINIADGFNIDAPPARDARARILWLTWLLGCGTSRNWKFLEHYALDSDGQCPPDYEKAIQGLSDIEMSDHERFVALHDTFADRILKVGKTFWYDTGVPCLSLNINSRSTVGVWNNEVKLTKGFRRGMPSAKMLSRFHFPLDEAVDAVEALPSIAPELKTWYEACSFRTPFDLSAAYSTALQFDRHAALADDVAFGIASNLIRRSEQYEFHPAHRGQPPLFEDDDAAAFARIRERVMDSLFNPVVGEGMRDLLGDAASLWRKAKRPTYDGLSPAADPKLPRFMIRKANAARDMEDIALPTSMTFGM